MGRTKDITESDARARERAEASDGDARRLLDEVEVFSGLSPDVLDLIASRCESVAVAGGDVLIRQGDVADSMYIVGYGRLRVSMTRDDGEQTVLAELGRGDVVGEMAMITNDPRTATVTAVRVSQVFRIPADAYIQLVQDHPDALRQLAAVIVRRLVRSVREGTPARPVATVAVVPLGGEPEVLEFGAQLAASLQHFAHRAKHITPATATASLRGRDRTRDRGTTLPAWLAMQETDTDIVVYETEQRLSLWTNVCVRQADLILFVGRADTPPHARPIEGMVRELRERTPCRTELVLVHRQGTLAPRGTRRWLQGRDVARHHHVEAGRSNDVDHVARLILGRGLGLVFSGGGARGIASLGVLRALQEKKIPIDAIGGTSIGAIIASLAACGRSYEQIARGLRSVVLDASPFDITFPSVSLAAGRRVTSELRSGFDGLDLEDAWRSVYCVSTNLTRGGVEIHRNGPAWWAVRASFSLPGVYPPMRTDDGELLVDGGLLDNLPVGIMRREHEGITVIAVDIGRTRDLVAGAMPADGIASGWQLLLRSLDPFAAKQEMVRLPRIMMRLTELGGDRTDDRGDLYIRPPIDAFGITDFKAFDRLFAIGYEAGLRALDEWHELGSARSAPGGHLPSFQAFAGRTA